MTSHFRQPARERAEVVVLGGGIGGALTAMHASSIIGLFAQAYTLLACSVVPVLALGPVWRRDRSRPFTAGEHNCRITPWGPGAVSSRAR